MKLRPEQADALGGCADCEYAPISGPAPQPPAGDGPPPRSVIVADPAKADTWIGIELVDRNKKPVPYARFVVTPPGQTPIEGTLDVNGRVRIEGVDPGTCRVVFPNLDRRDFI
ncbi:MAG: hypothetical protein R2882_06035 [Gemmatimonadales bacterium]